MSDLLQSLIHSMDMVVLRHLDDDAYEALNEFNPWFAALWPDAYVTRNLKLRGRSHFLDHFAYDAAGQWIDKIDKPMKSGPFIETLDDGTELALEATALIIGKDRLLILTNLGEAYEQTQELLQAARQNLLSQEKLEIEVSKRTLEIREREAEVAGRLIYAAGFRDEETGAHIRRIGLYSAEIARAAGRSQREVDDIQTAAPMHDIGKIGIPDRILKKPGRLTEDEFTVMRGHANIGAEILGGSSIAMIQTAADIAGCHHEFWDGSGYPNGLAGEDIPLSARIVAIVDVYDALVHARVYKKAIPEEESLAMMAKLVGTQFDPALYELFLDRLDVLRGIRMAIAD